MNRHIGRKFGRDRLCLDGADDLVMLRRAATQFGGATTATRAPDERIESFISTVLIGDLGRAEQVCRDVGATAAISGLILPTISRIEELWASDQAPFDKIALGFWAISALLDTMAASPRHEASGRLAGHRCLVAPAPQDGHSFGAQVLTQALAREGAAVTYMANVDAHAILAAVRDTRVQTVCLSVGHDGALSGLADLIEDLRHAATERGFSVATGGAAIAATPSEFRFLGADTVCATASDCVNWLGERIAARAPRRN